jgi:CHAT domain-containing protein
VCLIPAGFWHFLPLHACFFEGKPLIERYPVFYGPSSSILSRPGDPQRPLPRCLAVGVEFEHEAEWVANLFNGRAVLGTDALAPVIVSLMAMEDLDIVHFACHGAYNPYRGSESGLILARNSWLTPTLIESGTTSADLIVLSACETAFDYVTVGNDLVGLDQALLNMGAVSVIGTLWKVETGSAEYFVKSFYRHLTSAKGPGAKQTSKIHALQAAIAEVRAQEPSNHPFFWAPFKLTGGWL